LTFSPSLRLVAASGVFAAAATVALREADTKPTSIGVNLSPSCSKVVDVVSGGSGFL